jgi:hypothetical protein
MGRPQFLSGLDPLLNYGFDVGEGFFVGFPIGGRNLEALELR